MRKSVKIMLLILAALLAAVTAGSLLIGRWLGRMNYTRDEDVRRDETAYESEVLTENETRAALHPADVYELSGVKPITDEEAANTYTLLVIGAENADETAAEAAESEAEGAALESREALPDADTARGDANAVIIMTINHSRREVVCFSFDTDLYVEIPQAGGGRLGNAYAVGGGPLLARTMEDNYGLHIDNYAAISFRDVARIMEMPAFETMDISKEGLAVVKELVYSLGSLKPTQVTGYISNLLPYVTHNMDGEQMLRLILQVPRIIPYYGDEGMVPGHWPVRELDGYLVPDAPALAANLREILYGGNEAASEAASDLPR